MKKKTITKKNPATRQFSPPMIRLRLPSEKPTREDADKDGEIGTYGPEGVNFCKWDSDISDVHFWFQGRLHDGLLSREPSQEEKWRAEFEEWWEKVCRNDPNASSFKEMAWSGFLFAKKGGAE